MRFQGDDLMGMSHEIPAANACILLVLLGKKNRLNIHPRLFLRELSWMKPGILPLKI